MITLSFCLLKKTINKITLLYQNNKFICCSFCLLTVRSLLILSLLVFVFSEGFGFSSPSFFVFVFSFLIYDPGVATGNPSAPRLLLKFFLLSDVMCTHK